MKLIKNHWIPKGILFIITAVLLIIIYSYNSRQMSTFKATTTIKPVASMPVADRTLKLPDGINGNLTDNGLSNNLSSISISLNNPPSRYGLKYDILYKNKLVKDYKNQDVLSLQDSAEYSDLAGVTCFRGNNYRNAASYGFAVVSQQKLEKVWNIKIGGLDTWTGVGWNGQPAIVKWDDKVRRNMNLHQHKKDKESLKEVIYSTLDGNIYFLDLDDGSATRQPIEVGYPHKGSITVDPRGYPLLYAGQGIYEVTGKEMVIGYRIFSLIDQKLLYFFNGMDNFALRGWGAFDSNGIIDKKTDTLILAGENGLLYTSKLNTKYDPDKPSISINPEITKYRYSSSLNNRLGIENSVAVYRNYAYFADNGGLLQCVDLNTLSPLWVRNINDDTDSTIALEEAGDGQVCLYTACEVDIQGDAGFSYIRKIDALTGNLLWEKSYKCAFDDYTNGGTLASPILGKHDISNLVIYNVAKSKNGTGGKLVAFDKKTGSEAWTLNLDNYCWSSPVDVYTKDGVSYLVVCDSGGNMMLIEGKSGTVLDIINLEANIEGSPAVYEDMIVVGTRGQKIWGVRLR